MLALAQTGSTGIREFHDLLYTPTPQNDSLQRLNLVLPKERDSPLLIWIGGGAWSYVDRDVEMDFARIMAQEGIAVASVGHRLSPAVWRNPAWNSGVKHPEHARDIASAVNWLVDQADEYGYRSSSIFIGGFSSGAHLAALVALDPSYLGKYNLSISSFSGILPVSGAYDIVDYYTGFINRGEPSLARDHVQAVFGESLEQMQSASPTEYLGNLRSPMLILSDNEVEVYTQLLEEKLAETAFRDYEIKYAREFSHADLWRDLSRNEQSSCRAAMIAFIRKYTLNSAE